MSNKILIANWKMNPKSLTEAKRIYKALHGLDKVNGLDTFVCPPVVYLPELSKEPRGRKVVLGVQDIFCEEKGAYTGQISPSMVLGYKAKLAILGHSERRVLGESSELVGKKVHHVIEKGLMAVLCVGEQERSEEGGYYTYIRDELEAGLAGVKRLDLKKLMIAYEPIWAIGKSAEEALDIPSLYEMVLFIRKILVERYGRAPAEQVPILYGGSVKAGNAKELVSAGGVDGLLVGSASLEPKEFINIATAIVRK
jgi:triosephosphate isomerase